MCLIITLSLHKAEEEKKILSVFVCCYLFVNVCLWIIKKLKLVVI